MSTTEQLWRRALLREHATIGDVIRNLDQVAIKIVLVTDQIGTLQGTISDGDVRRGLLKGLDLSSPITDIIHRDALVAPEGMGRDLVMQLMIANKIQQVPVVDENHTLVGLHLWEQISTPSARPNAMVIMAGGKGVRLRPYTQDCPKPMLKVAGKPMLEHIIERAKSDGFLHFILAIHYLGEMVEAHFGNGERLGVRIEYVRETTPLGTAGALSLLAPAPHLPFVVTNGDVITDIHYGQLLDFHIRHDAAATMAVRIHEWQHPFGVVHTKGLHIVGFEEKPVARSHINAGVYALSPESLNVLTPAGHCDMPMLFSKLQSQNLLTVAYPMHEPWLDVGRPDDLVAARAKGGE